MTPSDVAPSPAALLGEPALLLVESLIHELVALDVIDRRQAVDVTAVALEVQVAQCADRKEDDTSSASVTALRRIHDSLAIDDDLARTEPA